MGDSRGPKSEHKQNQLSFLEHLEVLRWILMRIVIVLTVFATVVFIYREFVFQQIIFASQRMDFVTYVQLCKLSEFLHFHVPQIFDATSLCFDAIDPFFLPGKMTGKFMTTMLVSIIGGAIIAFPYIIWEFWRFVSPALYPTEQKNARGLVFFSSVLFLAGILFGYFIINPLSVHFLIGFDMGVENVKELYPINSFMGIVASTTLATGVMFELPVMVYFLSKAGLVTPEGMRKYRKHAFVATLLVSAIITPPDVFSQILVSIPIVILYEMSIFISKYVNKKANKI